MNKFSSNKKSFILTILILFALLVIVRAFHFYNVDKTNEQIAKIHATKLTLGDVMGKNLPPNPGENADKTIVGVDANNNGIRDDVELAVFKDYSNSAKTRLPLLQYALALQLQMSLPVLNPETFTATVEDTESRADVCMWTLSSRKNLQKFGDDMEKYRGFIETLQLNNVDRKKYLRDITEANLRSFSLSNDGCDIDPATLPN